MEKKAKITWQTKEELEAERNKPIPPTDKERIEALEAALLEVILNG